MGGGGGGGPQTVSQTTIPAYAKPYMEGLLGKAASATIGAPVKDEETGEITFEDGPDYQPYDVGGVQLSEGISRVGQRLSDPTTAQQQARQNILGIQPLQGFGTGKELTQEAVAGVRGIPTQFTGDTVSDYMSPYMQNVVDVQKRKAIEDAQRTQLGANLGAVTQGTLGGSRQALMQGLREQQLGEQLGDIQATGQQKAYDSAMAQLERDRAAKFAQAQGLAGLGTQLGALDQQDLESRLGLFSVQEQIGRQQRAEDQAKLDQAYSDFQAQQRFPITQLGLMSDILRGSGNLASTGGQAFYSAQPSPFQQLAGLGLQGLGLYGAYGGFR
jgi:hypothetical protein